ncbi:phytanoyl-CoA dioxygenase family protein [Dokdonia sinensis]|uniref:phytanoyl-CoA dioxygenase family protein n=1 Tax=Dokdonia sinensis TaxID=2479847 RepID=UPI001F47B331|nr:phytanoyl-CoA dioxygenase family protein [Dokdonia sinensis]
MKDLIRLVGNEDYFLTKAIYFDKPKTSNWFVSYHQDLSISVNQKEDLPGYTKWTEKRGQIGVIPPVSILENIITLRIHLDDTTEKNGALKVIPTSHNSGILRKESISLTNEVICNVKRGSAMLMKPLTMHASGRSQGNSNRRVIHLEFSSEQLLPPLEWRERMPIFV